MNLFGTAGIRGDVSELVTPTLAVSVGQAVAADARDHGATEVAVGRDGRVSGAGLAAAVESGLLSAGVDVRRAGVVPTPALARASRGRYGVMLTASHNPPADNGIKLFADGSEFDGAAEGRIEAAVDAGTPPASWHRWGHSESLNVLAGYRDEVVQFARGHGSALDGLRLAVDCGNGTGALAAPQVLSALGADVAGVNDAVDGHFPARPSKPTAETLSTFRRFVADGSFRLGFGLDGDADRIVVVDGAGEVVHEDTVLAVLAEYYVRANPAASPVVITTPNASGRIDERVAAAGGEVRRVALGTVHEGLADARASGVEVAFAAEPWKHVHPGLGGWIDAVASAAVFARLVAEAGGLAPLTDPVAERPYRKDEVPCPSPAKAEAMAEIEKRLPDRFPDAAVDLEHGVRIDLPDGAWVLVRSSGTEPVIRLYAEGDEVDALLAAARDVVESAVPG